MKKVIILALVAATAICNCNAQKKDSSAKEVESMFNRFITYVSMRDPSTAKLGIDTFYITQQQREVAEKVYSDLRAIPGVEVQMSSDYYIYARIPSNIKKKVPSLCLMSHLDITAEIPEPKNEGWKPVVHKDYDGKDIVLGNGIKISPDEPAGYDLRDKKGHTIITSDGTTHLGGDCKAGVAILVELAVYLSENKGIKHGDIYLYFTQNEDNGMIAERFDAGYLGKVPDILLDLDSHRDTVFSVANFSAVNGTMIFKGNLSHPSDGFKSGFADSYTAASYWIGQLPPKIHPSYSKELEGYLQVYDMRKEAGNTILFYRLRYFNKEDSALYTHYMEEACKKTKEAYPRVEIQKGNSSLVYDNVAYSMHPKTSEVIVNAGRTMGWELRPLSQRSGTTCAFLACKGIGGGSNIFGGQHAVHALQEWVSIEELVTVKHFCEQIIIEVSKL